jgi:hypothetical protein
VSSFQSSSFSSFQLYTDGFESESGRILSLRRSTSVRKSRFAASCRSQRHSPGVYRASGSCHGRRQRLLNWSTVVEGPFKLEEGSERLVRNSQICPRKDPTSATTRLGSESSTLIVSSSGIGKAGHGHNFTVDRPDQSRTKLLRLRFASSSRPRLPHDSHSSSCH